MSFFGELPESNSYDWLGRKQAERYLAELLLTTMNEHERWRLLEPGFHFDDEDLHPEKYATPELKYAEFVDGDSVFHEAWEGPIGFQLLEEIGAMSNAGLIRVLAQHEIEVRSIQGEPPATYVCYCCGFLTLLGRGYMKRCPVCAWVDEHPLRAEHHPENDVSLASAEETFRKHGVSDVRRSSSVRADAIYLYEHAPGRPDPDIDEA